MSEKMKIEPTEREGLRKFVEPIQKNAIKDFCERVNRIAEVNMIKTGKLEGSHYAAMKQVRKEMGI